jgi:hypothetical protein
MLNLGMSPKDAALQVAQERNCAFVDAGDDAMVDNNWYTINNGLGLLDVRISAGRSVRGASGECRVVGKGQGAGTIDGSLLDSAKTCSKEMR